MRSQVRGKSKVVRRVVFWFLWMLSQSGAPLGVECWKKQKNSVDPLLLDFVSYSWLSTMYLPTQPSWSGPGPRPLLAKLKSRSVVIFFALAIFPNLDATNFIRLKHDGRCSASRSWQSGQQKLMTGKRTTGSFLCVGLRTPVFAIPNQQNVFCNEL